MRRYLLVIFIILGLISCGRISFPLIHPATNPTQTPPAKFITLIPNTQTNTPIPSVTPGTMSTTVSPSPSSTIASPVEPFSVFYHPDDVLYVGDQVSFEVVSPPELDEKKASVSLQVDPPDGPKFDSANFAPWGIQGRYEATMMWVWDTRKANPGNHTLSFLEAPHGYSWTEQVNLLPSSTIPLDQAEAHWAETKTNCCTVFYITQTASERDLSTLSKMIDAQAQDAIQKMGSNFSEPITVTVVPRLLGHGGFTSSEISVSYLDRNYASTSWALVVHHEMIHAIDTHLGGDFRPTIFVEGLAVYMTGGHYKPEPLMPRAAALLEGYLNWYLPLKPLADDFYASQHEIGYLEGASLIEYMINTYGLEAFFSFYRDIHNRPGESQSDSIDAALKAHFSISFAQLEQDFLLALKAETGTSAWVDDVRTDVNYYDTMRRYQLLLDPSAYFRTAWLLDNKSMRERGIVADYARHPHTPDNLALETLFITAGQQKADKDYGSASQTFDMISLVLDNLEHGTTDPFSVSTLTADYLSISTTLQQQGYEVQTIDLEGDMATTDVIVSTGPDLIPLDLQRTGGRWSLKH